MTTTKQLKIVALLTLGIALSAPGFAAKVETSGTVSVGGGASAITGDRAAFQKIFKQDNTGFGGLEDFAFTRYADESVIRFDGKVVAPGDVKLNAYFEKPGRYFASASFQSFRIYYDGSGGRLLPKDLAFQYFDESLAMDRSYLQLELGTIAKNAIQFRLRYNRNTRDGSKNSLRWGESNLGAPLYSPRAFIPSYLLVDEVRDIYTAEAWYRSEVETWKASARYQKTSVSHKHVARRRMTEANDRFVVMRDLSDTEMFTGHAFYERVINEKLRVSAGGLTTTLDTALSGNKIIGATPDSDYAKIFAPGVDNGYFGLNGNTQLKQYVGNVNATYKPTKNIVITPGIKYERLRQESVEDHTDTSGGGGVTPATEKPISAANTDAWNEVNEEVEVRYTRWPNLTLSSRAQWNQGIGRLAENSVLLATGAPFIDHTTKYTRVGQRYVASATWYAKPGFTVGAQYSYRLKLADYRGERDATNNSSLATNRDRYPQYLIDNDIAAEEGIVRISWRPINSLSLTTKYLNQHNMVTSTMDGLPEIINGRLARQMITQSAIWTASPRLYFTGTLNFTFDQMKVPKHPFTVISDNNYTNAIFGSGYAVGKKSDLYLDLYHYRADNYTDNQALTLPLNSGQTVQSFFLTWVRRQTPRLIYTAKYGYATNRDGTYGGQNDVSAHLLYGKIQYKF